MRLRSLGAGTDEAFFYKFGKESPQVGRRLLRIDAITTGNASRRVSRTDEEGLTQHPGRP